MKRKFSAIRIDRIDNIIAPIRADKALFYVEVLLSLATGRSHVLGSEENERGCFTMMMALGDKLAMDYNRGLISQSESRGRNPYWTVLLHDLVNHELVMSMDKEREKVGA